MDTQKVAGKTLLAVKQLGQYGRHFQSQDVREHLKYSEQSDDAHYMHNVLGRLKKQGIVEIVGDTSRKRNQYLKIVDEAKLRHRIDQLRGNGSAAERAGDAKAAGAQPNGKVQAPPAPKRVLYLEDRVQQLEGVVSSFDPKAIEDIRQRLDALDHKVTELVELWS